MIRRLVRMVLGVDVDTELGGCRGGEGRNEGRGLIGLGRPKRGHKCEDGGMARSGTCVAVVVGILTVRGDYLGYDAGRGLQG